jgi:hypothetical protein
MMGGRAGVRQRKVATSLRPWLHSGRSSLPFRECGYLRTHPNAGLRAPAYAWSWAPTPTPFPAGPVLRLPLPSLPLPQGRSRSEHLDPRESEDLFHRHMAGLLSGLKRGFEDVMNERLRCEDG